MTFWIGKIPWARYLDISRASKNDPLAIKTTINKGDLVNKVNAKERAMQFILRFIMGPDQLSANRYLDVSECPYKILIALQEVLN